jgi:hypothetical protein
MAVHEDPARLLDQIENLSRTHREHELYYSQAPSRGPSACSGSRGR